MARHEEGEHPGVPRPCAPSTGDPGSRRAADLGEVADEPMAADLFEALRSTPALLDFLEFGSLDGMWIWDLDHRERVWTTRRFRELLGYPDLPASESLALFRRIFPTDEGPATLAFERHLADPDTPYDEVFRYRHRDGSTVWVRSRGLAFRDEDGRPTRFVGVHTDLTATMRAQEQLAESIESLSAYSAVLEQLDRTSVSLQALSEPEDVLTSLVRVLGREVGEVAMLVLPWEADSYRLAAADATDAVRLDALHRVFRGRPPRDDDQGPVSVVLRTGEDVLVSDVSGAQLLRSVQADERGEVAAHLPTSIVCVPWPAGAGRCGAVMVTRYSADLPGFVERDLALVRQIVERHHSAFQHLQALEAHQAVVRFQELARAAPMAILQLDEQARCTFANDRWAALTGYDEASSLGFGWLDPFDGDDVDDLRESWARARADHEVLQVEVRLRHRDGSTIWVGGTSVAQFEDDGTYTGALVVLSDVTARREAEEELSRRARVDPLTGGANRFALFEEIDRALERVRDHDEVIGLVYLDLDTFKEVNDSLGHEIGDRLLEAVADRLRRVLRTTDLCARVGGDEFVLLLGDLSGPEDARRVAERVQDLLRPSFALCGVTIDASASMGLTTVTSEEDGLCAEDLLRRADRAMYRAKGAGRDRIEAFDRELDAQAHSEASVRKDISEAIAGGRLVLHYQPIVDLEDGRLVGVEALVRIDHPTRGLLAPAQFLDVAERSGQIVAVGEWVVREATQQLAAWHRHRPDLYLTLNLSGRQIADAGAADLVLDAVARNRLQPDRLVVEVTETTLIKAVGSAVAAVARIRAEGVRVAIDDFGTGYSSLARLAAIPADVIKLDRSFVVNAPQSEMHAAVIAAVLHLTERVGLDVVAEGIETEEQLAVVRELGCGAGQGFLFCRPVTAGELDEVLAGQSAGRPVVGSAGATR